MSLLKRLAAIDRTRERLFIYETRLRRLFFARALRDRQLARIAKRWHALTEERAHILGIIAADPVLRARLRDQEDAAARQPATRPTPQQLAEHARMLAVSLGIERDAKDALQDATAFVKWRDRDTATIPDHEAQSIRARFQVAFQIAQTERVKRQTAFEAAITALYPDPSQGVLERERLMRDALKAHRAVRDAALTKPNAFAQWHHLRTGQWPTPERAETKPTGRPRRREREREPI